ncbi:molybdenum cofactor biosynthesis protein MoaE [Undibacterium sp. LX40W]|uniref:Molybdopterin synthase catalytic subunit n=1 Tax=Undibacterium nitidum TaxID=2762298 RepID=A0A923HS89_9BURK|nr:MULTISPECIES: molybdenum cofactor biosynthesis protein MoaE [Undibacterium]MBC3883028.1 molybdenum cofactor biosynthesis protein MoaE [Undibacterium nitidum]MBC3893309.1 molybdenum cofactor biosynthesis protein MoaE [Undibacterium sp. LX40W]
MHISVQTSDFDVSSELKRLHAHDSAVGAVVSFVGLVRDLGDQQKLIAMELEHYPGMTEKCLLKIAEEAKQRWKLIDCLIIHRVGRLQALDQIVLVAAASAHRGDAFSACEFMMDYLKTEAPFWKKEIGPSGAQWVDARSSDDSALAKWKK